MDFRATNKLNGDWQSEQEQKGKEVKTVDGSSFIDTMNAKVEESEAQAASGAMGEGRKEFLFPPRDEMMRFRRSGGVWGYSYRQRKRIEAEQRQREERYEKYVKMLRASSLKRSLQEADRRYCCSSVARDVALNAYGVEFYKKYSGLF